MDNETLFYVCGGIAAVSAVLVTFAGLKLNDFPGRLFPLVIVWFTAFAVAAGTFSVLQAQEHEAHEEHKLEQAGHEIEEAESGGYGNEAGALGGETEEAEEEAEEAAGGSEEEEPVGEVEGGKETSGCDPAAGATVFAENCAGCHGEDGHGGGGGPDLREMPLAQTEAGAIEQVTNGGGGMPPFGGQLSEAEISDVAAFVVKDVVGK